MKTAVAALGVLAFVSVGAMADTYVHGYTRSDGTYVAPYHRSSPDSSTYDNWSTRGNVNPYTGAMGTHSPDLSSPYGSSYGTRSTLPANPLRGLGRSLYPGDD